MVHFGPLWALSRPLRFSFLPLSGVPFELGWFDSVFFLFVSVVHPLYVRSAQTFVVNNCVYRAPGFLGFTVFN